MTNPGGSVVVTALEEFRRPGELWQPVIGAEAHSVVSRRLPSEARELVLNASASILSKAIPPATAGGEATGLVVGYVQSGKTLSFTTALALARDNGFQLVIVVAGTSTPLLNQSTQRLRRDLQIDNVDGPLRWHLYTNPIDSENHRRHIQQTINDWRDPDVPTTEKATVLVTVMKQHRHLGNLVSLLRNLRLQDVPTLVVDDEADQASLNTLVARGRQSTTYRRLLELRAVLPGHTFLQYTATPQAPLLINIIDALSPGFVEVLEPGAEYVGGREFFLRTTNLVEVIPPDEIPSEDRPLFEPPESLLEALRVFLIGVAAGLVEGRSAQNANRSMLVHPSQRTEQHREYRRWIGDVFDEWQRVLELPEGDSDRLDLILNFRNAYENLQRTVPTLLSFDELARRLPRAFRLTRIEEINARGGQTPIVDWSQSYGWILVGGQAMDRGFTVEGLTVTYMPRGPGVGNADTVQQRGRFFGYKRRYLGFCRIYLEQAALTAFQEYVEHEEFMRGQLEDIQRQGLPLREWKRAFVLSPALRPCRHNVLQYAYARGNYADAWFYPAVALAPARILDANRSSIREFLASATFTLDANLATRELTQRHIVCRDLPLARAVADLLVPFRVTGASDTNELIGVMLQLSHALELDANEACTIYQMSPESSRERATNSDGRINELFQGPTRTSGGAYSYPGDRAFHDENRVTIQVHHLSLRQGANVVAERVPVIAVWIPRRMALNWVAQDQQ
jgi:hypothetical protein